MDNATAAAVIQSQLDDIDDLLRVNDTDTDEEGDCDARLALQIYREDIKNSQAILEDRRIACSIGAAVESDSQIIEAAQLEEDICLGDRRAAMVLGEQRDPRLHTVSDLPPRQFAKLDDALVALNRVSQIPANFVFPVAGGLRDVGNAEAEKLLLASTTGYHLQPSFDYKESGTHLETGSGSAQLEQSGLQSIVNENSISEGLMRPTRATTVEKTEPISRATEIHLTTSLLTTSDLPPTSNTCISCADDGPSKDMVHTTCAHSYCLKCTTQYVEISLRPDSTFPLSCCDLPLTLAMIENHVSLDVMQRYTAKQDEIANAC